MYALTVLEDLTPMGRGGFPCLSYANLLHLTKTFSTDEIEKAVRDMEAFKGIIKGRKWNVVSGTSTMFWVDSWLKDSKLADFCLTVVPDPEKDVFVRDY
ncbi:hypothetical protein V2J09_013594 [Rumex salicifolius]